MQMRKFNLVVTDLPPCRKNGQKKHISSGFGSDDGCKVRGELPVMSRGPMSPFIGAKSPQRFPFIRRHLKGL